VRFLEIKVKIKRAWITKRHDHSKITSASTDHP
jgi:hypothetical protein